MKDKKEFVKIIIVIFIILSIGLYNFFTKKEESYEEIEISENILNFEEKVIEEDMKKIKVYIIGEVNKPGVVELENGARIEDAIILAGGTTDKSDLSKVNLAYTLEDGQKIKIPSIDDESEDEYIAEETDEGIIKEIDNKTEKININKADINELCTLTGVGEAMAQKIIDYRNENGKFESIEDLKNVNGIGEKKYESLKEYISIK